MTRISLEELTRVFRDWENERAESIDVLRALSKYLGPSDAKQLVAEREQIAEAVRKYHVSRGCCDGTFTVPCPFKAEKPASEKARDEKEQQRLDALAFQSAELDTPGDAA